MDKLEDEPQEESLRDLQEERFRLTGLKEHPGYRYLMEIAEAQIHTRMQAVFLTPLKGLDETFSQEYYKGEISGIKLFKEIVDIRVKELTDAITEALKEQENSDGRAESSSSNDTEPGFDDNAGN